MHIAIIGATGLVGSGLLSKLLANDKVEKITTITRKALEDSEKLNQLILSKMDAKQIQSLSVKADVFICALGTTIKIAGSQERFREIDCDFVVAFAKLAKKENAKAFFVVSAIGSSKKSRLFYSRVKGEMEEQVLELGLRSTYILRPGMIVGNREEKRPGEALGISFFRILNTFLPKSWLHFVGSTVEDLASYIERESFAVKPGSRRVSKFS